MSQNIETDRLNLSAPQSDNESLSEVPDGLYFDDDNYRNEIIWGYCRPGSPKMRQFNRKHDVIHWYSKSGEWVFNADLVRMQHHPKTQANYKEGLHGSGYADTPLRPGKVSETWWIEQKGSGLPIAAKQKTNI